jgi:hypothetical protein
MPTSCKARCLGKRRTHGCSLAVLWMRGRSAGQFAGVCCPREPRGAKPRREPNPYRLREMPRTPAASSSEEPQVDDLGLLRGLERELFQRACTSITSADIGVAAASDMLTAMTRELVTESGVVESAGAVWRRIQAENTNFLNPATITYEPVLVVADAPLTTSLITPTLTVMAAVKALKFGSRPPSMCPPTRRIEALAEDVQYPLF